MLLRMAACLASSSRSCVSSRICSSRRCVASKASGCPVSGFTVDADALGDPGTAGATATVGAVAGALFVVMFTLTQNKWKIDDVLGVWPLHGVCGAWGGLAAGIFGLKSFGGLGGVSFGAQVIGTFMGVAWALIGGIVVYGVLKITMGLKMSQEEEYEGADLTVHKISASPDREVSW
jgi:ammonia channel protein AmtB